MNMKVYVVSRKTNKKLVIIYTGMKEQCEEFCKQNNWQYETEEYSYRLVIE